MRMSPDHGCGKCKEAESHYSLAASLGEVFREMPRRIVSAPQKDLL